MNTRLSKQTAAFDGGCEEGQVSKVSRCAQPLLVRFYVVSAMVEVVAEEKKEKKQKGARDGKKGEKMTGEAHNL